MLFTRVWPFMQLEQVDLTRHPTDFKFSIANKHVRENNAMSDGVVLAIAFFDHCRCFSIPRCARVSSNVTSMFHLKINQLMICSGDSCKSVLKNASALSLSRVVTRTQRIESGFSPGEYQR
jgi:hypothetical protein